MTPTLTYYFKPITDTRNVSTQTTDDLLEIEIKEKIQEIYLQEQRELAELKKGVDQYLKDIGEIV